MRWAVVFGIGLLLLGVAGADPIERDPETVAAIAATAAARLDSAEGLRLVVSKSRYRLDVWRGERLVKAYPIAMGDPVGAKRRQGDQRTPEGTYTLVPHHPSPSFGGCFYICYPNRDDAVRGLEAGLIDRPTQARIDRALEEGRLPPHGTNLGGLILLHGTRDREALGLTETNWTLGCIAMENADLLELLSVFGRRDRPTLRIDP